MNKRFQVIMAIVVAVMAIAALSAGIVTAQQDSRTAWNPSVTQADSASYCGNALCTGNCDGSCGGACNGNCTNTCVNGSCLQGTAGCVGGNCTQVASGRVTGCRGGGSCH